MKIFLMSCFLFVSFYVTAQTQYTKQWKRIDSLVEKTGLIKTALKEVNTIYSSAKKENNDVQVIKALVYRMSLNDQLSDSGRYENIALLEKEIATAKEPARSILHSIAGGTYWQYLQMNRWQFYRRSTTKGYDNNDISTWTISQLNERISTHFKESISAAASLKKTTLEKFDPIIIKGNVRSLRPTLFDLLAFRALDYFRNDEMDVSKPAWSFEIRDSAAFADAAEFIKHRFTTNDTLSNHHKAIELYQELLAFHLGDAKPDALIDADIDRLQFVKNFGTHPNKDLLFKRATEKIIAKYNSSAPAAQALYQLAEWYMQKARSYDPLSDTSARYYMNTARELCEKIIAFKTTGEANFQSGQLIKEIDKKDITLKAEVVNTTKEPFRVLLTYRNSATAFIRVVKFSEKDKSKRDRFDEEGWKKLTTLPAVKNYSFNLPETNDHQMHRVELKIDSLPAGEYGLLVSTSQEFGPGRDPLVFHRIYVSDISFINSRAKYYALNRKTGAPLSSAVVRVWDEEYNGRDNTRKFVQREELKADANGFFEMKNLAAANNYRPFFLEITHGKDRLFLTTQQNVYNYYPGDVSKDSTQDQTFLFSDRSIYRPGQTVFFKGISVLKNLKSNNNSVIANREATVYLYDANGEEVDSVNVTTNEFGSYNGKFTVPMGALNGQFRISDDENDSELSIHVEEYKRPKFYVETPAPSGSYRVNDTIKVQGTATSYAGNSINAASVKYRVVRVANIPMWSRDYMPRIWPPYPSAEQDIIHGTTATDENGRFVISFVALQDNSVPRAFQPVFNYSVYADVTDINGETISSTTSVSVGYQAMKVDLDVPAALHSDSLKNFVVRTINMNDSFIQSDLKISMYKLKAPEKVFRSRYWEQPDQFIMSKQDYYRYFPYDQYADETNKTKWAIDKLQGEYTATSKPDGKTNLWVKNADAGWYVVEAWTKDKFGDTVRDKKYVQVYTDKVSTGEASDLLAADKNEAEPGQKIKYALKTNLDSIYVVRELIGSSRNERSVENNFKNRISEINITDADRGTLMIKTAFVRNNRFYFNSQFIAVPFINKELKIEYSTYRDKTLPNSKENWKVKISGVKGDRVAAELLTSMYDASLDALYPHSWSVPDIWGRAIQATQWMAEDNFASGESQPRYYQQDGEDGFVKQYDHLLSNDNNYSLLSNRLGNPRGALQGRVAGLAVKNFSGEAKEVQLAPIQQEANAADAAYPVPPPPPTVVPRTNLNETAFFFPDLKTDSSGNVEFSFTTPEALTKWNWKLLAHTRDLAFAYGEKAMVTQKQLMVQPNAPRFLREGDNITFAVKVANMSDKTISGTASMRLFDPSTGKEVNGLISRINQSVKFSAPAGQSVPVSFVVKVPASYTKPLMWRIMATSDNNDLAFSDGEENIIPVLSNRMLVTETITLPVRNSASKSFKFEKLINSGSSSSLKNNGLTVEYTSNPAWYAVQALPYLSEVKDENAEQVFNRYYANAFAFKLSNSFPKLKAVIEKWKTADTSAFLSNLQKNQELKTVLLEETAWMLEAKTEAQQKKNIALLFDLTKMGGELNSALTKLESMQIDGGFVWYNGGPVDRFMTQYIVTGIGRLKKSGAVPEESARRINAIATKAIAFIDNEIKKDYDRIKNKKAQGTWFAYEPVQYLYMRTFFPEIPVPKASVAAYNYYKAQAKQGWVKQSSYMRALIALTMQRTGDASTAKKVIAALKESAIENEEMGMYWKDMRGGYYWYEAPVETQSILIEAFGEVAKDNDAVNSMKTWLLKNKQTNNWKTTKATADACYALLLRGENWIGEDLPVTIQLGEKVLSSEGKSEAGTGYFRAMIPADSVKPSMGHITVNISGNSSKPSWGGVYWQYFEDLDKISNSATALRIDKKLFVQKNTDRGIVIEALDKNNTLRVGDRVKVRIEIRSDRDLEYVHLKDMRASALEPVNVLSGHQWRGGLGYYESTKDASSNFYFDRLPKGSQVFEYDLFVTHEGTFNNGVATIQCMYAPEFSSHTEGIKVNVVNK